MLFDDLTKSRDSNWKLRFPAWVTWQCQTPEEPETVDIKITANWVEKQIELNAVMCLSWKLFNNKFDER